MSLEPFSVRFFLVTFDPPFWPFLSHFWPYLGLYIQPFLDQNRTILGDFGPFLGRSGVTLGSLRDHFGIVLASFWGRFGIVLTPFWAFFFDPFELLFGPFGAIFSPFLGHFYGHFAVFFLVMFWELDLLNLAKWCQGREKQCKFLPKFTFLIPLEFTVLSSEMMRKAVKTNPFAPINTCFAIKKRSKSTFQPMKVCSRWVCL